MCYYYLSVLSFASELGDELHIVIAFGNSQKSPKNILFPGWGIPARQFGGGGGSSGRWEEEKVDQETAKDSRSGWWSRDQVMIVLTALVSD